MAITKHCRHTKAERRRCRCSWYWDGYIDGRRAYRRLGPDRTEARRIAAQIEADRLSGRAREIPKDVTLEAVAERWIEHGRARGLRPQTLASYRTAANAVLRYFGETTDVRRIDADAVADFDADAFARRRGYGGKVLLNALRGILKQAARERVIADVPNPSLERRSIAPNPGVRMTEAEAVATLEVLSPPIWRDLADVVILTGLRISEALALRWDDVDFDAQTLRVAVSAEQRGRVDAPTKTRTSTRVLRVEPETLAILRRQPRADARIFPRRYQAAQSAIRRAMFLAGTYERDRGWHSLRHLNVALRDRAGQSIRQAGAELGHGANFVMTASYGWASEAAEPARVSKVRQR